jgi:hypothetical protein
MSRLCGEGLPPYVRVNLVRTCAGELGIRPCLERYESGVCSISDISRLLLVVSMGSKLCEHCAQSLIICDTATSAHRAESNVPM